MSAQKVENEQRGVGQDRGSTTMRCCSKCGNVGCNVRMDAELLDVSSNNRF